jgi:hypothetical protein
MMPSGDTMFIRKSNNNDNWCTPNHAIGGKSKMILSSQLKYTVHLPTDLWFID